MAGELSNVVAFDAQTGTPGLVLPGDTLGVQALANSGFSTPFTYITTDHVMALAVDESGRVVLWFSDTHITVGQTFTVYSLGTVPQSLAGQYLSVWVGPVDVLAQFPVGTTVNTANETATFAPAIPTVVRVGTQQGGGGPVTPPPTGGGLTITGASVSPNPVRPGQQVTVRVTVTNKGNSPASGAIAGSDTLGRTWGPVPTGTVPPGASVTVAMTSGATPAAAAGGTVTVTLAGQGVAGSASVTFLVVTGSGAVPAPPAVPPARAFPWGDVALGAVGLAGIVALAAGLSGGGRR